MLRTMLFALFFCLPALAEVPIDPANRLANTDGRSCGWCALETLGRQQGIEALYGIRDARQRVGGSLSDPGSVKAQLDRFGIRFAMQMPGNRDPRFLSETLVSGRGVAIGLQGRHVVVLVELTADVAMIVDNNATGEVRTMSRQAFLGTWDGWAIALEGVAVIVR